MSSAVNSRAGFVAIIGAPNAGKSTLVNTLVGEKVSIVTHKVQTTRFQVRGIAMIKDADDVDTQIVLVDTPGIFKAGGDDRLGRSMVHAAWSGVSDSDATVHMVVKRQEKMAFLALNKIDEIAHDRLLEIIAIFQKMDIYREIFLISALNLDGVDGGLTRLSM